MTDAKDVRVHRGLKDIYFERSQASFIDGKAGELRYRGYSIHDLAQHSTFEETAYLLIYGELPKSEELNRFRDELVHARQIPSCYHRTDRQDQGRTSHGRAQNRGLSSRVPG